jgi:ABC-type transport system substrate-binding protein
MDRAEEVRRESGDDGFKKAPIGAGPYRFVSFNPGVELVVEAYEQYWRKVPSVKRLVFKVMPDHATRLAALKRGDADVVYLISGELAGEVRRTQGLTLKAVFPSNHRILTIPPGRGGCSPRRATRTDSTPASSSVTSRCAPGAKRRSPT